MPVGEQVIVFFLLMTAGFLLGLIFFLYNFFCRKVRLRHQGGADFLLWVLLSLLFFFFLLWVNGGEFRFYVFIALTLGLLAFKYAKNSCCGTFCRQEKPPRLANSFPQVKKRNFPGSPGKVSKLPVGRKRWR